MLLYRYTLVFTYVYNVFIIFTRAELNTLKLVINNHGRNAIFYDRNFFLPASLRGFRAMLPRIISIFRKQKSSYAIKS